MSDVITLFCPVNAKPGCGLIRCGPSLIPFENHFPKNTKLYKLMTTNPNEELS